MVKTFDGPHYKESVLPLSISSLRKTEKPLNRSRKETGKEKEETGHEMVSGTDDP